MPTFDYRAVGPTGEIASGSLAAADVSSAQRQLRAKRLTPLSVTPTARSAPSERASPSESSSESTTDAESARQLIAKLSVPASSRSSRTSINKEDLLRFTSEMAVLLRAGLPLDRALQVQIQSAPQGPLRAFLEELLESLKGGKALSTSLERRPELFSHFYINMVRSGEAGGGLSNVLSELATYLERSRAIRSAVISALIYPVILSVVAILSIVVMLGFVVPEFETLFEDMGESLPLLTRFILSLGDMVANWGWLLLALIGSSVWWFKRWSETLEGRQWLNFKVLTLPLLGSILLKYEVARFARTLGTLLQSGVTILRATDISVGTVGNQIVRASLSEVPQTLKRGGRLSQALDSRVFSNSALQMVRVGEESGNLDRMLLELAQVYETEIEEDIKRALTMLEPALILGMGAIIAVIIMGILMGILSVNTLVV